MTQWTCPTSLPSIPQGATVALDTETHSVDLKKLGPQFQHGPDHIIGVCIAFEGYSEYLPIAHASGNCDLPVIDWLKEQVLREDLTFVFANAKFDLAAFAREGVWFDQTKVVDIQVTDSLINENEESFSLASIAKRRGLGKKSNAEMEQWMIIKGLIVRGGADYSRLKEVPPHIVAPYGIGDAELTLAIHSAQLADIDRDELQQVATLESRLIPILFRMGHKGIRVNVGLAEELNEQLGMSSMDLFDSIDGASAVDPFSSNSLSTWVRSHGFTPPETVKGNDSISNDWMLASGNDELIKMAQYRQAEKIRRDFIQSMILEGSHKGRLHPQWFQTRGSSFMSGGDTNGTKSGRLACTNPNLQQIPSRHPVYGPMVRGLFLPEEGELFNKNDYNSQEIRVGVHYAAVLGLEGAADIRRAYQDNPLLDYHSMVMEMINAVISTPVTRTTAKTTNLSLAYGMGKRKLAERLNMSSSQVEAFLSVYHREIPFVKQALDKVMRVADSRGYVKTILGRRRHFDEWENANWGSPWVRPEKDRTTALLKFGKIKRANTYKAYNSVIQGTSAEMTKVAIVNSVDAGLWPMLTVHDELCYSVSSVEEARRAKKIMEEAIELSVPVIADGTVGKTWADKGEKL
jgi:DNA polymerase I-like protein with 3'-5' exonuclease and polymerase domains